MTILAHLATNAASLARVRKEFKQLVDSSLNLQDNAQLEKALSMDVCEDLTYLGYIIQESMRVSPSVPNSSPYVFEEDITLGDIRVRAGDPIIVTMLALGKSSSEW